MDDNAILLVDSPESGLAPLAGFLQRHGYRTWRVSNDGDAGRMLEQNEPSLVFIDLQHPRAAQLCRHLRNTAAGAVTPIIMMGAPGSTVASVADALALGADFYFNGPWRNDAVLSKVKTYIGEGMAPVIYAPPPGRGNTMLLARIDVRKSAAAANQNATSADDADDGDDDDDLDDELPQTVTSRASAATGSLGAAASGPSERSDATARPSGSKLFGPGRDGTPAFKRYKSAGSRKTPEVIAMAPRATAPEAASKVSSSPAVQAGRCGRAVHDVPKPEAAMQVKTSPQSAGVSLPAESTTDLTALTASTALTPSTTAIETKLRAPPRRTIAPTSLPIEPGSWETSLPTGAVDQQCHPAYIMAQAWMAQVSGRLDWQQGDVRVCLWFYEGSVCGYTSNLAHDRLGEFLSRTGSIRGAAARQLILQNLPTPRLTLAYLVRLGEISAERVWPLLIAHLAEQTYGLFAWEAGTFAWHNDVMPLEERVTLGLPTPAWIMEGLRRKYDLQRLMSRLGGPATMVARHDAAETLAPGLHLGADEARLIKLLDGHRSFEDIAGNCGMALEEVYRVSLLLVLLHHAHVTARGHAVPGVVVGPNPVHDAQRITEKLQQVRLCDYFEILGIQTDAGDHEVQQAATQVSDAFHPSNFNHDLRMQYETELAEIAEIIADARDILGDSGRRRAYAAHAG